MIILMFFLFFYLYIAVEKANNSAVLKLILGHQVNIQFIKGVS